MMSNREFLAPGDVVTSNRTIWLFDSCRGADADGWRIISSSPHDMKEDVCLIIASVSSRQEPCIGRALRLFCSSRVVAWTSTFEHELLIGCIDEG